MYFTFLFVFGFFSFSVISKGCNVRDFGAKGDCKSLDTNYINSAISDVECDRIIFDNGCFLSGSIRLVSSKTLEIQAQATIKGAPQGINAYDHPLPNPYSQYQDFGHSHWQNSLIWGINVSDVVITGGGTIDGDNLHTGGTIPDGDADKLIGIQTSSRITISDLYITNTGHFGLLATNVEYLHLHDLKIRPPRDGIDIVSCRHVKIDNLDIQGGSDDAIALKSDFSLGKVIDSYDIVIHNCIVGSLQCNGLQLGSETVGDFYDVHFENCTVTIAGDCGIGIATMDGSNIFDFTYRNIVMGNVSTPIQLYIGARGNHPSTVGNTVGSIRNILIEDVIAHHCYNRILSRNLTASFDGQPVDEEHGATERVPIGPGITLRNVNLGDCSVGGGSMISKPPYFPPHEWNGWYLINQPRPSWGFFLRNVQGVKFTDVTLGFEDEDDRPAVILKDAEDVVFDRLHILSRSKVLDYDIAVDDGVEGLIIKNSPGVVEKKV